MRPKTCFVIPAACASKPARAGRYGARETPSSVARLWWTEPLPTTRGGSMRSFFEDPKRWHRLTSRAKSNNFVPGNEPLIEVENARKSDVGERKVFHPLSPSVKCSGDEAIVSWRKSFRTSSALTSPPGTTPQQAAGPEKSEKWDDHQKHFSVSLPSPGFHPTAPRLRSSKHGNWSILQRAAPSSPHTRSTHTSGVELKLQKMLGLHRLYDFGSHNRP